MVYQKLKNRYQKTILKLRAIILLICLFFLPSINIKIKKSRIKNKPDENLTIVTTYYKIKSKHSFPEYLRRLKNFVKLNHSIVFFASKTFINIIKKMRPSNLQNKTIFIEMEMEDFYSYKNFRKEFNESFYVDIENSYHTVPLYLIWAEKCSFLKKAIINNYFNSKCFYWVDAGYFVKSDEMDKYIFAIQKEKIY